MRLLPDWINAFVEYTEGFDSPVVFRRWAALASISAALQRKVSLFYKRRSLHANVYVIFVAGPASGKTTAILAAKLLLGSIPTIKFSPQKGTRQKLYMNFAQAQDKVFISPTEMKIHSNYTIFSEEFGTLFGQYENEFMSDLNDFWDCIPTWTNETKNSGVDRIEGPYLVILAGTTQKWISEALGDRIYGTGFVSRTIFVVGEKLTQSAPTFEDDHPIEHPLLAPLKADLKRIHALKGSFRMDSEAQLLFQGWHKDGMRPVPVDPRMIEYNARREVHLLKLSMCISAARRDSMIVTETDLADALNIMLAMECEMPRAFEMVGKNPLREQLDAGYKFLVIEHRRTRQPVSESRLRGYLLRDTPLQYIGHLIESLISAGYTEASGQAPSRLLTPTNPSTLEKRAKEHLDGSN